MKRALLICPDARPGMEAVAAGAPLALASYLGKPLLDHALDGLVAAGFTHVRLLVSDRPSEVRAWLGSGSAWGLAVEVVPEPEEPGPEAAALRHRSFAADAVFTLDSLPQAPGIPILTDPSAWHRSRAELLPLLVPRLVGARETAPGVWLGLKARVAPSARLAAPCWIGPRAQVGAGAVIGPDTFIESDAVIDSDAEATDSTVSSRTYLGSMTRLHRSIAAGSSLTNWQNGSQATLTDAFLLSHLDPPTRAATSPAFRFLALLVMVLTWPLVPVAGVAALLRRRPWFARRLAALPSEPGAPRRAVACATLPALPGHLARWPWLWRIVTGHFAWTGNPPLTPDEAAGLEGEFERLWVDAAPGIFTAAEAEGCRAPWEDAARAHAALFASRPTAAWRRRIVLHGLRHLLS